MKTIHISEIYPVSEVKLGSELYYLCELGKYLQVLDCQLSLDGIILDRILRKSRFWDYLRIANQNGYVVDLTCPASEMVITDQTPINSELLVNRLYSEVDYKEPASVTKKRELDDLFNISTPRRFKVKFSKESTAEKLIWTVGSTAQEELNHIKALGGTNLTSQCFVSLVAYVAIKRFMTKSFDRFELQVNRTFLTSTGAVSDLVLLEEKTNALDWFDSDYSANEDRLNNLGYEAWLHEGTEYGYSRREYSPKEKLDYFKNLGLDVGDVVGCYERNISQKGNKVKSIEDFHFAIVESVGATEIKLRIIRSAKLSFGYKVEFSQLPTAVKAMFNGKNNFSKVKSSVETYNWYDIGVEYLLNEEQYFITPLRRDDFIEFLVDDGKKGVTIKTDEVDYIYWLLKDYNVTFAEEKFLNRYFKNREPYYNMYKAKEGQFSNL